MSPRRRRTGRPLVFQVQATGRQAPADSMKHHMQVHCPLVEFNLLVRTSAADPIKYICVLDHSRCDRSVLVAPPPCEACAAGQGVPSPPGVVCRAGRGIAANRVRRVTAEAVRSVQVSAWFEAFRPCTRAGCATATGRLEAPSPSLPRRAAASAQFVRSFSCSCSSDFSH